MKKYGARILTVDQLEGYEPLHENWGLASGDEIDESGDPPRIWHPQGDYPVLSTAHCRVLRSLVFCIVYIKQMKTFDTTSPS